MPTANDAYKTFLLNNGATLAHVTTMTKQVLDDLGYTGGTVNDKWMRFLYDQGCTTGTINDRWKCYLNDLGYTGHLQDMLVDYWLNEVLAGGIDLETILAAQLGGDGLNVDWNTGEMLVVEDGVDTGELVADASSSNWTPAGANTVEDESGAVKITYVDNATGANFELVSGGLTDNLVAGGRYFIEFEIRCENGSISPAVSGAQSADSMAAVSTSSFVSRTAYFTSDGSEVLNIGGMSGTEIGYVRNISLIRIDRSYSGPIQDHPDFTYTGVKKMVVGPDGLLGFSLHNELSESNWNTFDASWLDGQLTVWDPDVTVTENQSDPFGGDNASLISEQNITGSFYITLGNSVVNVTDGRRSVRGVWLRYSGRQYVSVGHPSDSSTSGSDAFVMYDLINKTVETSQIGTNATLHDSGIIAGPDDWCYCWFETTATNATGNFRVVLHTSNSFVWSLSSRYQVNEYSGDSTKGVYVCYARRQFSPVVNVGNESIQWLALPTEYDILTFDGSSDDIEIASSGEVTLNLDGSVDYRSTTTAWADSTSYSIGDMVLGVNGESFTCTVAHTSDDDQPSGEGDTQWKRDDLFVRVSATSDVDGAYMLGRVKSQSGTTLTLEVLKSVGSGSYDDWHVIAVKGVADEPVATNRLTYSEALDNATGGWFEGNSSPVLNYATGPDGQASATRLIDNNSTGSGAVFVNKNVTSTTSTVYTASIFAKEDQLSWAVIQINGITSTGAASGAYFDLSSGSVGTVAAALDGGAKIVALKNGWYRCSVTFTSHASTTNGAVVFLAAEANNDATVDRDGTSSILVFGSQFEPGSVATSYIPTAGAAVERAADIYEIPKSSTPIGSAFTIAGEGYAYEDVNNALIDLSNGTEERTTLTLLTGTNLYVRAGNTNQVFIDAGDLNPGVMQRVAGRVVANDFAASLDGGAVGTDVSGSLADTDTIRFGAIVSGIGQLNGGLSKTLITNTIETDAELRARAA